MRNHRRVFATPTWILGLALVSSLTACDKGGGEGGGDAASKPAADGNAAAAGDAKAERQAKTFLKEQSKKACEMLTPAMVAEVFSVPEAELEQMKIAGCIYGWNGADEGKVVEASLTTIWVKNDAADARAYFDTATKSLTAEEVKAQLGAVQDMAKNDEAIDTKAKEQTVDQVGGVLAAMVPDEGYQYEDVDGLGDAARVLKHDGSLTVLVGNMVFSVRAYGGAAAPDLDMAKLDMSDAKAIMAAAKQRDAEWMTQTRDVRKQQGVELAKSIVAAL